MKMMNRIQNRIKRWIGENLGAKIMAILFALFMWIYVMSVINPVITDSVNNIPVELLNMEELESAGLVIQDEENHTVDVRVTGRSDQVYRLSRQDFVATADLSGHQNIGANNVQVSVEVDAEVEVEFSPQYIRVQLEEVVRKQRNVDINILGEPAAGYVLGEPRITPSAIWVEGPESMVNSVEAVVADLQLEGESSDVVANLTLKPVDSRGDEVSGVRLESEVVEVILPIEQTKTVIIQPNLELEAAEGYTIRSTRISPRSITIQGPEDQLEGLTRIETELVERSELAASEEIEVGLILPEGIRLYSDETITVEIEVSETVEEQYEVPSGELRTENLAEGLSLNEESLPESLIITVTGPEDLIENLSPEDVEVLLNLEDLASGTHTLVPEVEIADGIDTELLDITVEPAEVSIEILDETVPEDDEGTEEEDEENPDEENGQEESGDNG